jgi:DNA-binding response OmpR family regulator
MRLLLAEDDQNLRGVLARGLREEGYVVDAVANGSEAIDYLRIYEYAVCILDWRMPGASPQEMPLLTGSTLSTKVPTTTLSSRSTTQNCSPGYGHSSAGRAATAAPCSDVAC